MSITKTPALSRQFSYISLLFIQICTWEVVVPHTIVTRLVHYTSIYAPNFSATRSMSDVAEMDFKSSMHRASYLTANQSTVLLRLMDLELELSSHQVGFLAHLQVGSDNLEQEVYMDTGSGLLWINCEPCGYNVPGPIFDPNDSSTFEIEDCSTSTICRNTSAVQIGCNEDDRTGCRYQVQYGTRTESQGYLARERFKFGRSKQFLDNIVFGCSRSTTLRANGMLGLSLNPLSLLSQTKSTKFAYCFGNISDKSYAYNTLVIGDGVELTGYQSPLIVEEKFYMTLEGIKIGDEALDIDPQNFVRVASEYKGGMLVDTGSTSTLMPLVELKKFERAVTDLLDYSDLVRNYSIKYEWYQRFCFNGVVTRDLDGFPTVQFLFQGGLILNLTAENIFQQMGEGTFCLAIVPSEILNTSVSLLGNLMQQFYYVAYDLKEKKIAFKKMECDTVERYIHDELIML